MDYATFKTFDSIGKDAIDIAVSGNTEVGFPKLDFLWKCAYKCPVGDIVEVGVYRGGTGLMLATGAKTFKPGSKVYLCDTFTGIALSGEHDNYHKDGDFDNTSVEHVNNLLSSHGLDNFYIVEGIFPRDTGHLVETRNIGLLHIDVDVYEGYRSILEWSRDRLVDGAIIVLDDYNAGTCLGATKAVDEFIELHPEYESHLKERINESDDYHFPLWSAGWQVVDPSYLIYRKNKE